MAYRSPLERLYEPSGREDHRYAPYNRTAGQGHSSQYPSHRPSSSFTSQRPGPSSAARYSDRFRPAQYPRELTEQFEALVCKLCGVEFTSPITGKMHYSGKPHAKKIKSFLAEWSEKTGLPIPDVGNNPTATGESMADYCELCDVTLISLNDKLIHYSGKHHRRNERDPNNARKKKAKFETVEMHRFGIGTGFCKEEPGADLSGLEVSSGSGGGGGGGVPVYECKLCEVRAVSKEQLQIHLTGKKHKEKLAKQESGVTDEEKPERKFVCDTCNVALETYKLFKLHCDGKRHKKNISKKAIVGGADFCELCQIKFNSISHYNDHVQGKKHEKMLERSRLKEKKREVVKDETFSVACKYCTFVGDLKDHNCDKSLLKIDFHAVDTKYMCPPCNQLFENEEDYKTHKESRRHLLCVLNQQAGDKIVEQYKHFYCYVCKKQYITNKEYTDHLFQDRHAKLSASNLEGNTDLYLCKVCDVVMDMGVKVGHEVDPRHLKKALVKDYKQHLTLMANETLPATNYECTDCNITFDNFVLYGEHILGDEHINRMIEKKIQLAKQHTV